MRMISQPAQWEQHWCEWINRLNRRRWASVLFGAVSRLGDGVFWYTLMALLPLVYGWQEWRLVGTMLATGLVALLLYKVLKRVTHRPRPCADGAIHRTTEPLDLFSFPSGHTMHAVAFTWLVLVPHPELGWFLVPFAILVAVSRLVLGLHYPSDVLVGGLIGGSLASVSMLCL